MRRLMLLRHGKSDWPAGVPDLQRPIAERGRRASKAMGHHMVASGFQPERVLVSPALRTRQTWEIAGQAFSPTPPITFEPAIYEAEAIELLSVVQSLPEDIRSVLMVGHNPGLQDLALLLAGDGDAEAMARLNMKYSTAGLAILDLSGTGWSDAGEGCAILRRFDTPRSIEAQEPI
jgi:phosphohistidine phosphatase